METDFVLYTSFFWQLGINVLRIVNMGDKSSVLWAQILFYIDVSPRS